MTKKLKEFARKTFPTIEVYEANGLNMPFPDCSFDTVCCKDLLEHLNPVDVLPLIREMWRVTKLKMMIAFFLPPREENSIIDLIELPIGQYWNNQYNAHDLKRLFKKLELGEVEIRFLRSDAARKLRRIDMNYRGAPLRITHAPLYIFMKNDPNSYPSV